jgi:hypothetical protein
MTRWFVFSVVVSGLVGLQIESAYGKEKNAELIDKSSQLNT